MRSHSTSPSTYPTTEQILDAIKEGVYEAFSERLDYNQFPLSFDNIGYFLAKGVTDAFLDIDEDETTDDASSAASDDAIKGPNRQRKTISRLIRMAVWDKTDGHCAYCGERMNPFSKFHVDHVHPVADGGGDEMDNLWPACQPCNNAKHAMSLEAFRAKRGGGLFWFEIARNGGGA